jgi:hypothetical protein
MSGIRYMIEDTVKRDGFTFVAESVCDVRTLFALACDNGWGFLMEPWSKRRCGYEHPMVSNAAISEVISHYVGRLREARARIAELESGAPRMTPMYERTDGGDPHCVHRWMAIPDNVQGFPGQAMCEACCAAGRVNRSTVIERTTFDYYLRSSLARRSPADPPTGAVARAGASTVATSTSSATLWRGRCVGAAQPSSRTAAWARPRCSSNGRGTFPATVLILAPLAVAGTDRAARAQVRHRGRLRAIARLKCQSKSRSRTTKCWSTSTPRTSPASCWTSRASSRATTARPAPRSSKPSGRRRSGSPARRPRRRTTTWSLGNHAEFLGVMSRVEMLAMFFVHDGGETQKWRLKGHAEKASSGSGCARGP